MNVMLDLETMGNTANSAIIAIGAVKFGGGKILDRFHQVVSLESCIKLGLQADASTILWWMQQSDEARSVFKEEGVTLGHALNMFTFWIGDDSASVKVWGNGASFDNTILSNAYQKASLQQPWKFWNDRCYRTVKSLYPEVKLERVGVYHNACDDAESQALHLMKMLAI